MAAPWEHGSEFAWSPGAPPFDPGDLEPPPWLESGRTYGTGRCALRALLQHQRQSAGWRRLWVPSYLCQEVVRAAASVLPLSVYPDSPLTPHPDWSGFSSATDEGILLVNYFGLRGPGATAPDALRDRVIEDHTHDPLSPWARNSAAPYCVASLRKVFAIADGGALWSPLGRSLPASPTLQPEHAAAAAHKLAGMVLKAAYLSGAPVDKADFLDAFRLGEGVIGTTPASAMSPSSRGILRTLARPTVRAAKARLWAEFSKTLEDLPGLRVLRPHDPSACPFSWILQADDRPTRDALRAQLIASHIYPAILWPLDEAIVPIDAAARSLADTTLSIHADLRYSSSDQARVLDVVKAFARVG